MKKIEKIAKNLSKYMLGYTLLIIIVGIFISYAYSPKFLSKYIMIIVFLMIYFSTISNVSFENLKRIKISKKTILIALSFNFIFAPFLFWLLCMVFRAPQDIKIALLLLAIAPASSMGLGYVGLSKGNMISASIIVASAFILSLIVYPITFHLLNIGHRIVPFSEIIKSLIFVLVLPFALGLITREGLIEKKGRSFKEIKPYSSLATLITLYILIFLIFALKGQMLIKHWRKVALIAPIAFFFYTIMISIALIFNKYLIKLDYEDNQAIIFTTVSKNVALTIGLLATVFGKSGHIMATYPAIISIFQMTFLMIYLHFSEHIRKWWIKCEKF